ncbi:MAG: glycosyltransferase [Gemmataceae bacterium]|nr:glycosyltransferase [Gemmataceae bacterium]MDW8244724.1 glycosyltransferase [Thermogemmata sp.]
MATRNYGHYLSEAVESVRRQTYPHWELWIIDDGSTDGTRELVRSWPADERIHYVYGERWGQAGAKNVGIRLSRGEWIAFLDADDRWEPLKLSQQVTRAQQYPQAGLIYCRRRWMDANGQELLRQHQTCKQGELPQGWVLEQLVVQNFVCFSSAMVHRLVLAHVGLFDEHLELAIDYDLWLRVAMHYEFAVVDQPLVWYRTGHGNLSRRVVERGQVALAILERAVREYGLAQKVSAAALREARASTCRTLGYVQRSQRPLEAARWYWRAWWYGGSAWRTWRGWAGCLRAAIQRPLRKIASR